LGNRKRSFVESPYPSKKFEYRHNVENVILGIDSSAVIVEDTGRKKKKNPKKKKSKLSINEVVTNEAELKLRTEAMIIKQTEGDAPKDKESYDGRGRKSLGQRFKEKYHQLIYGNTAESG